MIPASGFRPDPSVCSSSSWHILLPVFFSIAYFGGFCKAEGYSLIMAVQKSNSETGLFYAGERLPRMSDEYDYIYEAGSR